MPLHPFEWGGEHENIENAQAFLEEFTAQARYFLSSMPEAPTLGSDRNFWYDDPSLITFKSLEHCRSVASSPKRFAKHVSPRWEGDRFYQWEQPIDWTSIDNVGTDHEGVFFSGRYTGLWWEGSPLSRVTYGDLDLSDIYSFWDWNIHLQMPEDNGMRERVMYAVTYLEVMCGRG